MGTIKGGKSSAGGKTPATDTKKKEPKKDFVAKAMKGVNLSKDVKEVAITSDGQVFELPRYLGEAKTHQANKGLELVIHKI